MTIEHMILYLDIDGVLNDNTDSGSIRRYDGLKCEHAYSKFCELRDSVVSEIDIYHSHLHQLDLELCLKLEQQVRFMYMKNIRNIEIVVCSTWRKVFADIKQLRYLFYLKGIPFIARRLTRYINENKKKDFEWIKTAKTQKYIKTDIEFLKGADIEVLYDLYKNNIKKYKILSDDISCLKNNFFMEFKRKDKCSYQ